MRISDWSSDVCSSDLLNKIRMSIMTARTQWEDDLFEEKQQFRQLGIWALLLVTCLPVVGILGYQLLTGQLVGDRPASGMLLLFLSLLVVLPVFLRSEERRLGTGCVSLCSSWGA